MRVQIVKAVMTRRGHHEVTTCVSSHALNVALVVTPRGPTKLVIKQVISTCIDQNSFAHWRFSMDMMREGCSISLFQASQQ